MFGFFKKSKKEASEMTEDERQIKKAKEDIAEKGKDSQTEKDRIDESVGEQERRDGNENSQNAKDRVDESEGTKKYDERKEEKREEETPAWAKKLISAIEALSASMGNGEEKGKNAEAAKKMEAAFGVGEGTFPSEASEKAAKKMSKDEIADIVRSIM